jgi:diguanylate cyclase (GGDEF)-like protein
MEHSRQSTPYPQGLYPSVRRGRRLRPALFAGRVFFALCVALPTVGTGAVNSSIDEQLKQADSIKTANHEEFRALLAKLDGASAGMDQEQHWYLHYLKGWESGYDGKYSDAIAQLNEVLHGDANELIRFRAGVSLVNVDAISLRYDEAFKELVVLSDKVDKMPDTEARMQFYGTAALLYGKVGEFALAEKFAGRMIDESRASETRCKGSFLQLQALFKSGVLKTVDPRFDSAQQACAEASDPVFGNEDRQIRAHLLLSEGDPAAAIRMLLEHYQEVQDTGYAELISGFDSVLAKAYLQSGDRAKAADYAQRVVAVERGDDYTEALIEAFKVLYLVDKAEGNTTEALAWHEKYMDADRGYLNEVGVRSLAYEKVKQQVENSRAETQAAEKQNRILELQRSLAQKSAETRGLYALMITLALLFMAVWAWRLKRAQMRLRTLAQRDSLTGIMNRQFFVYTAERVLQTCGRTGRDACLVLIDLDHFKLVNDSHGHAAGDIVLKRVVAACQTRLRASDLFGRLGGEEFGILMPECPIGKAMEKAEQLRRVVAAIGSRGESFSIPVSASLGVATTARVGYQLNDLMIHADEAMYRAKARGRNCVVEADGKPDPAVRGVAWNIAGTTE